MPYVNGQYVAPSGSGGKGISGLFTAPKAPKKKKKKGREGDGGFLGLGVGPSVTDLWDETQKGIKGAAEDFIGLGSMVGQTASDFAWAGRHAITGDTEAAKKDLGLEPTYDKHGNYTPRGIGTVGAAAVGMASSMAGTAADIADSPLNPLQLAEPFGAPDIGGLIRSGTQEGIEGAARLASGGKGDQNPGGRWIVKEDGSREWQSGDWGSAADQVAQDMRPRTYMDRAKQRGFLSPLIEDVGNVAMAGALITKGAGLAGAIKEGRMSEWHPLRGEANNPTTMAHDAGGAIAKVDKVGRELSHPLRNSWERTGGQLVEHADTNNLRNSASPDPLLDAYLEEQGRPASGRGVVQKAKPVNDSRLGKLLDEFKKGAVTEEELAKLPEEDLRAIDASKAEDAQIKDFLERNDAKFDVVDAKENPYYEGLPVDENGIPQFDPKIVGERMRADIQENNHLYVDNTGSFGENAPPGYSIEENNVRRAVHDYLGHRHSSEAGFDAAGENLAYGNESEWYTPDAARAAAFQQQGPSAMLAKEGNFPDQQITGALPAKMADPEYLAGASPWARKIVDQLNPEGVVNKMLTRMKGTGEGFSVKTKARELAILVEAERNRLAHSKAATMSVEAARYLVDNFKIKAEDANTVVHDMLKDRIVGREAIFQDMVAQDPGLGPYLEDAGWVPEAKKLPEEVQAKITPEQMGELDAILSDAHAAWEEQLAGRIEILKQSRPGLKGLEDVGRQEVIPTKTQIRQQKQIKALLTEAEKLRTKAMKAEKEAVEKQIAGHEADIQRRASAIQQDLQRGQGQAEAHYNERVWKAKGFKGKKWEEQTIPAIVNRTLETGGATWNPYDDNFISARWAPKGETPLPPGVREIEGKGHAVSIFPRTPGPNGEPPMSTFEIPLEQAPDLLPGILDRMKGFAPLYENGDISIGTWIEDGKVHVDLSQTTIDGKPIDRPTAMLLGTARNQLSVTDLAAAEENYPGAPGSVRIARQMLNSPKEDLGARQRVARQQYEMANRTMTVDWNGQELTGPMMPFVTLEDIDANMAALDYQAWVAHRANPEKYPSPAAAYKDMEFRFAVDASRVKADPNRLSQTYLGATVNTELWRAATGAVKDWEEKVAPWYHRSKEFIDKHFAGKEVTLLDGSKRPANEFFTDMLAILSVSADPKANLKYALTGFDNLEDFNAANNYNASRVLRAVKEMMAVDPKKRDQTAIFKELTRDTHLYPSPKKPLMELLMGTKLDDMTPDYFAEVPQDLWGSGAKSVTKKMQAAADAAGGMDTPEGQAAAMEEGGSRFYAKIKSFKDNLSDPANSTSVTLDSWMARLFGEKDWMNAGSYREYANQLRDLAKEISLREGREVKPHEVQAVLWGYAKQEIGRLDAGVFRAQVNSVIRAIEDGNWHPENDGVLDGFAVDQAQLDRALARRDANQARIARRDELVAEKMGGVKSWSKHVPAKLKKEIMAQVDAEMPEQPGAWHPETQKVVVERSDRTRPTILGETPKILAKDADPYAGIPKGKVRLFRSEHMLDNGDYASLSGAEKAKALEERQAGRWWTPGHDYSTMFADDVVFYKDVTPEEWAQLDTKGQQTFDYFRERQAKGENSHAIIKSPASERATVRETVDRTTAITRPLTSDGPKESQAAYIERNLNDYLDVADEARRLYDGGDPEGAKQLISSWANQKLGKMEASANEFGDFQDALTGAPEGLQAAMDRHGMQPQELLQMYNRDVKGSFLLNEDGKRLTHFYQTADPTTLTHEGAHMLRTFLGDEDLHALEMNLGFKPGEKWNVGREEQFANMMTAWMATGSAPATLQPLMQRLKAVLGEGYTEFNRRFNSERINPETDQMFRELFSDATVPDITGEVQMLGKAKNIPIFPETGQPILDSPTVPGGPNATGVAPNLSGVSSPDAYRSGVRAARLKGDMLKTDARIRENMAGMARAEKAKQSLAQMIEDEMLPGQKAARQLEKRATGRQARLDAALENAPSRQWPREFRPLGEAIDSLVKDAAEAPELAAALEDVATNFPAILERFKELGGDPSHIRDFTEGDVKKLMYDTIRLGDVGKLGKETQAGTRRTWTGALAREGRSARSIEALGAAIVEVHHELRTNQLVDFIEQGPAVPWKAGDPLPHNYVEWDPIRNRMTGQEGQATAPGTRYIVPKQVDTVLKRMNQDFNHGIFRGLSKITNPWRGLILTLSPRWYVNNFAGNLVLASLEGVRLQDWKAAWASFKDKDAGGRYADVPAVSGHAFVSDVGERNMVPTKSIKEAVQTGDGVGNSLNRGRKQAGHNLRRANEVVDEFARSAVYHRTLRVGGSEEQALFRAQRALIDYGDMSPFEQQIVRSVVPFYAWQKGILKVVARMPIDHPIAAGVMMQLGAIQNQINADRFGGELPIGYGGLVGIGGGGDPTKGAINTRGFNPFGDSLSLTTPEGIAGSINPFADLAVRKALGAPEGGFVEQRTLSSYGTAVPDIPMGTGIGDILTGLPQAQLGASATGNSDKGVGQQTLKSLGLNYLTADDIKKIVARTRAAKAQIEANAPFPAKKKKAKLPSGLTKPIL